MELEHPDGTILGVTMYTVGDRESGKLMVDVTRKAGQLPGCTGFKAEVSA